MQYLAIRQRLIPISHLELPGDHHHDGLNAILAFSKKIYLHKDDPCTDCQRHHNYTLTFYVIDVI